MRPKYFHFNKAFNDNNGRMRMVTIVGKVEKIKDNKLDITETNPNATTTIFTYVDKKQFLRKLTYAYAICHPDDFDNFNEEVGVRIATRRIKTNPLGEMWSHKITTLTKQQVEVILKGELDFIGENIDKFIEAV